MTGLFLILIMVLWLVFVMFVVLLVIKRIARPIRQMVVGIVLFLTLLPLPLVDEIIGKWQFEKLCAENSTVQVDRKTAVGKTVYLKEEHEGSNADIEGKWLKMRIERWTYLDATTNEVVVSYGVVHAERKWLRLSESGIPFLSSGYCIPGGSRKSINNLFVTLNINQINRSDRSVNKNTGD